MIAALIDTYLAIGLLAFSAGFVLSDLLSSGRPPRRDELDRLDRRVDELERHYDDGRNA